MGVIVSGIPLTGIFFQFKAMIRIKLGMDVMSENLRWDIVKGMNFV